MKKILCMIALSLLMVSNLQAQITNKSSEQIKVSQPEINLDAIPKGAWKLVIHTNKTQDQNYLLMGETILDENYLIEKAFRDFHTIRTFPQGKRKMDRDYILNLVAKDSTIVLTGLMINPFVDNGVSMPDYARIENRGMSDAPLKACFREMVHLARIMANEGEIEYVSE